MSIYDLQRPGLENFLNNIKNLDDKTLNKIQKRREKFIDYDSDLITYINFIHDFINKYPKPEERYDPKTYTQEYADEYYLNIDILKEMKYNFTKNYKIAERVYENYKLEGLVYRKKNFYDEIDKNDLRKYTTSTRDQIILMLLYGFREYFCEKKENNIYQSPFSQKSVIDKNSFVLKKHSEKTPKYIIYSNSYSPYHGLILLKEVSKIKKNMVVCCKIMKDVIDQYFYDCIFNP